MAMTRPPIFEPQYLLSGTTTTSNRFPKNWTPVQVPEEWVLNSPFIYADDFHFGQAPVRTDPQLEERDDMKLPVRNPSVESIIKKELPAVLETIEIETRDNADEEFEEYISLSKKLGVTCGNVISKEVTNRILQKMEIPVYSYTRVADFLTKLQNVERTEKKNSQLYWNWLPVKAYEGRGHPSGYNYDGMAGSTVYNDKIPLFALRRMAEILEKIPGAQFYVSQLNMPDPDPFLAFRDGLSGGLHVIAHWDEPGFKLNEK